MSAANLRQEFEELLYYEAWLLDHDRLEEWLELFADNVRYWVPVRTNQCREDHWRRANGKWRIEERLIILDHDVLENVTVLF